MKRFFRLLTSILLLTLFSYAQAKETGCKLTIAESPNPLGLRLGMSSSEASFVLGRKVQTKDILTQVRYVKSSSNRVISSEMKETHEPIGEEEYTYYPRENSLVGRLFLRFWRDKLYTIGLNYDSRDFKWSSAESESSTISERLGFPKLGWNNERLTCNGFYITLNRSKVDVGIEVADSNVKEELREKAEISIAARENYLASPPVLHKRPETKPILKDPRKPPR